MVQFLFALALSLATSSGPRCDAAAPVAAVASPHPLWCIPTAVVAVLQSRGIRDISPRDLAKNVAMWRDGTSLHEIGQELDRRHIGWLAFQGPISLLAPVLKVGGTAPIAVIAKSQGHHAVVIERAGCCSATLAKDCKGLWAMDPATGSHGPLDAQLLTDAPYLLLAPVSLPARRALAKVLLGGKVLAQGQFW